MQTNKALLNRVQRTTRFTLTWALEVILNLSMLTIVLHARARFIVCKFPVIDMATKQNIKGLADLILAISPAY